MKDSSVDIFISYARLDRDVIVKLVNKLNVLGLNVWYDQNLTHGASVPDEINRRAAACRMMIVAWSQTSTTSHWVLAEAESARTRGVLCPILH